MSFYGAITEHLFNACRRDYVRRNIWKCGEFGVCMFGLLFASLCAANSYNVRFKCEMEYWFINSIYGEHNLQKFTNVFIKWNFIRWLFGLQSYFHTISDRVDVVVCVATKHAFTKLYLHSLHPPGGRYENAIESKCRCLVRWRWCHSPFQNMFWNKLLSM